MAIDSAPIINAYIGPSGSGKTFKALMDIAPYERQIRLDAQPHGQEAVQEGCKVVNTIPELRDYVKAHINKPFKVCLWPQGISLKVAFDWICKTAIVAKDVAILADEAHRYIDRNLLASGAAVFFQSRHSQTRLFYTMFNPRYVSPEMRGNTSKIHIFKNLETNVTDYLKGAGATVETQEAFKSDSLPKYSYALIETGKRPIIVKPTKPKKPTPSVAVKGKKGGRRSKK